MEALVNVEFRDDSKYAGDYLSVKQSIPLNAEPSSPGDLTEHWITPDNMFYQRNHGPIQFFDYDTFQLVIRVDQATAERVPAPLEKREMKLGLKALEEQGWPKKEVAAALQCAGNRRDEMSERGGKTEGLGCVWIPSRPGQVLIAASASAGATQYSPTVDGRDTSFDRSSSLFSGCLRRPDLPTCPALCTTPTSNSSPISRAWTTKSTPDRSRFSSSCRSFVAAVGRSVR